MVRACTRKRNQALVYKTDWNYSDASKPLQRSRQEVTKTGNLSMMKR